MLVEMVCWQTCCKEVSWKRGRKGARLQARRGSIWMSPKYMYLITTRKVLASSLKTGVSESLPLLLAGGQRLRISVRSSPLPLGGEMGAKLLAWAARMALGKGILVEAGVT